MTHTIVPEDYHDGVSGSGPSLPAGLPLGSRPLPASPTAKWRKSESRGTNTPSVSTTTSLNPRPGGPVGARQLAQLREGLSERDMAVLHRVAEHRYLTTAQLQAFCFTDHGSEDAAATTARRVLRRLEQHRLIRRLSRRIGGVRAGSSATIWQLAPAGARLVREHTDGYRTHEPSPRFLRHCLAVADAHLQLRSLTRNPDVLSVAGQVEPLSWRSYLGPGGERRTLQPDLYSEIVTSEYLDRWFIEVDCGTESLTTLMKKCHAYETYRATGSEQHHHGVFPRVLWIMGGPRGEERATQLRRAIHRTHDLTPELYAICMPEGITKAVMGDEGGGV